MLTHKDEVFLLMARQLGELSTCDRAPVGAIITLAGRAVSWGYNGAPPGMPHCDENNHGWGADTTFDSRGCKNAIHAEVNAVAFAARVGNSTEGGTLFVSVSPCESCSRLLISAGINRVVYHQEYRDRSGIELLGRAGIGAYVL
jgi:dCMP deaminase